jgi:Predicted transcriptional regulator
MRAFLLCGILLFMSQTERIYYMMNKLYAGGRLTRKEVADRFEVSIRQVGRDIEYIRERLDEEIVYVAENRSYMMPNAGHGSDYSEYRYMITRSVVNSLLGLLPLGSVMGTELNKTLSAPISDKARGVMDKIVYHAPRIDLPDYEIFSVLVNALAEGKALKMSYTNRGREKSERIVEPLRLLNYDSVWYLIAYDHKRAGIRTFHLSRIGEVEMTEEKISFSNETELRTFLDSGFGIFLGGNLEQYRMRFTGDAAFQVRTEIWHEDQTLVVLENGDVELTVPAKQPYELVGRLLTFAGDGIPLSPPAFVDLFFRDVEKLSKITKNI